jgi:general secretion pathway protein A
MNAEETREYVRHRLNVAGQDRPIFTEAALRQIHQRSGGVPR